VAKAIEGMLPDFPSGTPFSEIKTASGVIRVGDRVAI
jgi:hypothetical protein